MVKSYNGILYFGENEWTVCTMLWFNLQDIRLSRKKSEVEKKNCSPNKVLKHAKPNSIYLWMQKYMISLKDKQRNNKHKIWGDNYFQMGRGDRNGMGHG